MFGILKLLVGPVTNWFSKRQENKAAEQRATNEWESSMGRSMENGWKDEFVTVVICFPLIQIFVGNLVYAFTDASAILDAQKASMEQIGQLMGTPYGELMMVVVLAAVGIKGLKVLK